eukprot:m.98758 g.98758  ORF g.98758 m.98758 type:complete len:1067 (+) comp12528_c0_seq3:123-3323(+)
MLSLHLRARLKEAFEVEAEVDEFVGVFGPKHGECNKQWASGELSYRCLDCQKFAGVAYCIDCFYGGGHQSHNYIMYISSAGGSCDCGFDSRADSNFFCEEHKVKPINEELVDKVYSHPQLQDVFQEIKSSLTSWPVNRDEAVLRDLCALAEAHWGAKHLLARVVDDIHKDGVVLWTECLRVCIDTKYKSDIITFMVSMQTIETVKKEMARQYLSVYGEMFLQDYEYTSDFSTDYSRLSINFFSSPCKTYSFASLGPMKTMCDTMCDVVRRRCHRLRSSGDVFDPDSIEQGQTDLVVHLESKDELHRIWCLADDFRNYILSGEEAIMDFITNEDSYSAFYEFCSLFSFSDAIVRARRNFKDGNVLQFYWMSFFHDSTFTSANLGLICQLHLNNGIVNRLKQPNNDLLNTVRLNTLRCLSVWAKNPTLHFKTDNDTDTDDDAEVFSIYQPLHCSLGVLFSVIIRFSGQNGLKSLLQEFVDSNEHVQSIQQLTERLSLFPLLLFAGQARILSELWKRNGDIVWYMVKVFGENRNPNFSLSLLLLVQLYMQYNEPKAVLQRILKFFFREQAAKNSELDNTDKIRLTALFQNTQYFLLASIQENPLISGDIQTHIDNHVLAKMTSEVCGMSKLSFQSGYCEDFMRSYVSVEDTLDRCAKFKRGEVIGDTMTEGKFVLSPSHGRLNWGMFWLCSSSTSRMSSSISTVFGDKEGYSAVRLFSPVPKFAHSLDLSHFARELLHHVVFDICTAFKTETESEDPNEDDDDEEEGEEEQEAVKQGSGDKKEIKNYTTPKPITTTTTQTNLTFEQRVFSFLSSDRASALRQRIATAFEDVSMSSFADTYTNEECDVWDLQIALYVQAILFHNSKTRRRGLPSLRQPRKVIEDAASHARQKMYEMELKKKIDRIRVKMASEKAFDRRGYQLQLQHMFLLAHGDLPRTFTPAEVSEMNAARPLDDQIELTPSGLPRHRCAHVNCAKYLEDLSTDRDRSLGTRHGLYKHLSPLMHPEVQYMPRYHLFIQTLRVKEWTSDKKFVEDAMEKYSRWKGKSLPRDQKKCLRSFLQITWAMNSGAN